MVKFAIFSDIHFHNWTSFSSISERGLNTRLEYTIKAAKKIVSMAQMNECSAILFAGDFFHTKKIDADVLYAVSEAFEDLKIPMYGVPGNHDFASVNGDVFSSKIFSKINWFTKPDHKAIDINGVKIKGYPYAPIDELIGVTNEEPVDVFLAHVGIKGAQMGDDYVSKSDGIEKVENIGLFIAGHYHTPRLMSEGNGGCGISHTFNGKNNILIPGSPEAHNFNDISSPQHGFWILDLDKKCLDFHEIDSPKFINFSEKTKPEAYINNYVRIRGSMKRDREHMEQIKSDLTGLAAGISIDIVNEDGSIGQKVDISKDEFRQDIAAAIEAYSSNHCASPDEACGMKELGLNLYHEATKANGE